MTSSCARVAVSSSGRSSLTIGGFSVRALVSTSPVTKPGILGSWKPFQPISTHTNFRRALCATCVTTATSAKPIARPPTISATPCRSTSPMTSWQVGAQAPSGCRARSSAARRRSTRPRRCHQQPAARRPPRTGTAGLCMRCKAMRAWSPANSRLVLLQPCTGGIGPGGEHRRPDNRDPT